MGSAVPLELTRHVLPVCRAIDHANGRTLARERRADCTAKSSSAASDQRDTVAQTKIHEPATLRQYSRRVSVNLGLFLPTIEALRGPRWLPGWTELRELALLSEQVGFHTLWVPDHLIFRASAYWKIVDDAPRGTWEAWTLMSALAAATSRVQIGPFISASSFRQPGLVAKMATTLDEISGGRLILGIGTGSHQPEYPAFGFEWDHLASRFDEALRVLVPLLREGRVDFRGRYYRAEECELLPRGPRPGGLPIWIAAFGPRLMRLTAEWAEGLVTAWYTDPAELETPFRALDAACESVGRDPATLARCVGTFVDSNEHPERTAERLRALAAAGATHVTCMLTPADRRGVEQFGRVIEQIQ
jgi:alkanesulfonate monooxygenase SsuD/methylene tetrahydromethanopterin reductase-like flavin-dependent oxidoreductase (luciferase family)